MTEHAIVPIEPGTFLRMSPENYPGGKFVKDRNWRGREIYFEGHPIFEVKSYILDREGGHVTFESGDGTFYVLGGGKVQDVKFPFPHPMFQVAGEAEVRHIREDRELARAIQRTRYERCRWKWPNWLRFRTMRACAA